jgi:hypothetical protein
MILFVEICNNYLLFRFQIERGVNMKEMPL